MSAVSERLSTAAGAAAEMRAEAGLERLVVLAVPVAPAVTAAMAAIPARKGPGEEPVQDLEPQGRPAQTARPDLVEMVAWAVPVALP